MERRFLSPSESFIGWAAIKKLGKTIHGPGPLLGGMWTKKAELMGTFSIMKSLMDTRAGNISEFGSVCSIEGNSLKL